MPRPKTSCGAARRPRRGRPRRPHTGKVRQKKASHHTLNAAKMPEDRQRNLERRRRPSTAIRCGRAAPTASQPKKPGRCTNGSGSSISSSRRPRASCRWNPPNPRAPRTESADDGQPEERDGQDHAGEQGDSDEGQADRGQRVCRSIRKARTPTRSAWRTARARMMRAEFLGRSPASSATTAAISLTTVTHADVRRSSAMSSGHASRRSSTSIARRLRGRRRSRGHQAESDGRRRPDRAGARRPPPSWPVSAPG